MQHCLPSAAVALAIAGASASPLHAQTITRTVAETLDRSGLFERGPSVTSSVYDSQSSSLWMETADLPDSPALTLTSFNVVGEIDLHLTTTIVGRAAWPTKVTARPSYNSSICGGTSGCDWGMSDYGGSADTIETDWFSAGEQVVITYPHPASQSYQWTASAADLSFIETYGGEFHPSIGISPYEWWAYDAIGSSVPVDHVSTVYDITMWATISITVDLEFAAMSNYCASQANATGQHGRLEAYGADIGGTDWLTIRAADIPNDAFCVLFRGTAPANVPGATTTTCVAGSIQRVGGIQRAVQGTADFEVDLIGLIPGDTAHFQCFHRDPVFGIAATDAYSLPVQ